MNPFTGTFSADGRWQISPGVEALFTGSYGDTRLSQVSPPGAFDTEQVHSGSIQAGVNADSGFGLLSLSAYRNQALVKIGADHTVRLGLEWRDNADSSDLVGGRLSHSILAGVGYRVTDNLTLALTAQQFNQARIVETAGPLVERSVLLSATVRLREWAARARQAHVGRRIGANGRSGCGGLPWAT